MRLCTNASAHASATPPTIFAYDAFPHAVVLFDAPAVIGAQAELVDVCTGGATILQIDGTGVW